MKTPFFFHRKSLLFCPELFAASNIHFCLNCYLNLSLFKSSHLHPLTLTIGMSCITHPLSHPNPSPVLGAAVGGLDWRRRLDPECEPQGCPGALLSRAWAQADWNRLSLLPTTAAAEASRAPLQKRNTHLSRCNAEPLPLFPMSALISLCAE